MRSDRRTLIVLAVFLLALIVNPTVRSYFFFGARLAVAKVTLRDVSLLSTQEEQSRENLNGWAIAEIPQHANDSRDEKLGLALVQTLRGWNQRAGEGKEAIEPLEQYCRVNPDDLKAKAHLLRMALNIHTIDAVRDKKLLSEQAERMASIAAECAAKEPDNWYWRERLFHFTYLAKREKDALTGFVAQPLPKMFEDYVPDEIVCKQALYRGQFFDLPEAALTPLWVETIYPHFGSFQKVIQLVRANPNATDLRLAEIQFGKALMDSGSTWIAMLVGTRNMRYGLWTSAKSAQSWQKQFNSEEDEKMHAIYARAFSETEWKRVSKLARNEIHPSFPDEGQFSEGLRWGHIGPMLVSTSILSGIIAFIAFGLSRTKLKAIKNPAIAWPVMLLGSFLAALTFGNWKYLVNYTFGAPVFSLVNVILSLAAIYIAWRIEDIKVRIVLLATVLAAFLMGLAGQVYQATSISFLALFLLQRARVPLNPWAFGVGVLLASYHASVNLAFSSDVLMTYIALICTVLPILSASERKPEPDQPRLSALTVGLAVAFLGIFLTAQYDRGMASIMQRSLDETIRVKTELAKL